MELPLEICQRRAPLLPVGFFLLLLVVAGCGPGAQEKAFTPAPLSTATATATAATTIPGPTAPAAVTVTATVAATATSAPVPSVSPAKPTASSGRATAAAGTGVLKGHANIGPLTPVERVGVPTPTAGPEVCTSRGLAIYAADGTTPVTSFSFQPDCSYQVELPPGTYVVKLRGPNVGVGGSRTLPKTVSIDSGQTVVLDVDIDTGIR